MRCPNCGTSPLVRANFCHNCGHSLRSERLPAVRETRVPALWSERRPSIWHGLAALALGTAVEVLHRELVRSLQKGIRKNSGEKRVETSGKSQMTEEFLQVRETLFLRRTTNR